MTPKLIKFIVAVVIIGVAFLLIKSFLGTPSDLTLVGNSGSTKFIDDKNIVSMLNRLDKVSLDDGIFTSPVFTSLSNFERVIDPEPIGRRNPFAPIGTDGIAPARPTVATSTVTR